MSWFDEAVETISDESNTVCEAGHLAHVMRTVMIDNGTHWHQMLCFDAELYRDTPGYCPGDDDVSRTLLTGGRWEAPETSIFHQAIARNDGDVIDIGTHVGWYTMIGLYYQRDVLAIEAVDEHECVTHANACRYNSARRLHQAHCWVGEDTPVLWADNAPEIAIAKIDIEGNEGWALEMLHGLIDVGLVKNILMEISPVFNDSYPDLVHYLLRQGYTGAIVSPWTPFTAENSDAAVNEYPQVDMIFSLDPWWLP